MVEVQQNTELTASYLDLVVDTLADRLDKLFDVIRSDVDIAESIAGKASNSDRSLFEGLQVTFSDKIDQLIKFMQGAQKTEDSNKLDELETKREEKEKEPRGTRQPAEFIKKTVKKVEEFVDAVINVISVITGLVAAPFVLIGSFLKELTVQVGKLDSFLGGRLSKIFSPIIRFFRAIADSKIIQSLLKTWRETVVPFFQRVGKFFFLLDEAGKATGSFGAIVNGARAVGTAIAKFSGILTVIIGAFEFVTGFAEGFSRGGFIEGLKQGIVDAFDAILGSLIRLVTDIPGFILSFIGLKNFGAAVSNLGDSIVDAIIQTFESAVDIIVGLFTLDFDKIKNASIAGGDALVNLVTSIADVIFGIIKDIFSFGEMLLPDVASNFLSSMLRSILPDPSKDYGITDPRKYIAMAVPDSVYEFAGLNPNTGELIESDATSGASVDAGSQLQVEAEARRDAELEMAQGRAGGSGSNAVNVATNIQNNSNTTTQTRPPASSQPDNMSDTMLTSGFAP